MARNLKIKLSDPTGLVVDGSALLCPNPEAFYSKAYITSDVVDNFRALPGVKSKTKLAKVAFDDLLKESTCSFTADNSLLDAIEIDTCAISALAQICRFDLEQSFLATQMASGSNGSFEVANFMAYYWDEMAKEIGSEIEQIRWRGNTTGETSTFLDLCDGYEVKLKADSDVVKVTGTSITSSNVLAEMIKAVEALPAQLKTKRGSLRFHVASNVALAYELAAAQGNTQAYITQSLGLSFLGIKVVVGEGLSDDTMVLTTKDNLIYAFDAESDEKALKAVNLEDSVAEPLLRTRANMKVGFYFVNPKEIVFYS